MKKVCHIYEQLTGNFDFSQKKIERILDNFYPDQTSLINKLPGAVFCCLDDEKWTFLYLNQGFEKLTGYKRTHFIMNNKRAFEDIICSQDRQLVRESIHRQLEENDQYQVSYRIKTKNGQIRWVSAVGHHLQSIQGLRVLEGFIIDISSQKKAELELAQKNELIHTIICNIPIGIAAHSMDTKKLLFANDSLKKMFGCRKAGDAAEEEIKKIFFAPLRQNQARGENTERTSKKVSQRDIIHKGEKGVTTFMHLTHIFLYGQNTVVTTATDNTKIVQATDEAKRQSRLYALLSNIDKAIVHNRLSDQLLLDIPMILNKYGQFHFSWVGLYDEIEDVFKPIATMGMENVLEENGQQRSFVLGPGIREGKPLIVNNLQAADEYVPWKEEAVGQGFCSCGLFPFSFKGKLLGLIAAYSTDDCSFTAKEIDLFKEVTHDLSFAFQSYEEANLRALLQKEMIGKNYELQALIEASPLAIFELDQEGCVQSIWNQAAEKMFGYKKQEVVGKKLPIVPKEKIGEFKKLVSRVLKGESLSNIELTRRRKDGSSINIMLATAPLYDHHKNIIGVMAIISDITQQKRIINRISENEQNIKRLFYQTIESMSFIVETKDPYTSGHQKRVAKLASSISRQMGMDDGQRNILDLASVIHDIGKIYIPQSILSKPGNLTEIEFSLIKLHPESSYQILKNIDFPWPIAEIVLQHHERLDGSGYPKGLQDQDILIEAKILAVADVMEAMSSHRPYRPASGIEKALEEIRKHRGKRYEPAVVDAAEKVFKENKFVF